MHTTANVCLQVARILGCSPVVGICSSEEECNFAVSKFKFSAALNKNSKTFSQDLRAVCPGGVNIFIDNSGGDTSDAIILQVIVFEIIGKLYI